MKFFWTTVLLLLLTFSWAKAQSNEVGKSKFKVWVSTINDPFFYQGSLYALNDSSIVLKSVVVLDSVKRKIPTIELTIAEIEMIEVRRKNRVGIGGVIGAFTGLAVGGILGFASGDEANGGLTASEKAAIGGFTLAIPGALVGVLVGSSKIIIPINRSASKFEKAKPQLRTYSRKR